MRHNDLELGEPFGALPSEPWSFSFQAFPQDIKNFNYWESVFRMRRPSSVVEKDYGQGGVYLWFLSPPLTRQWHWSHYLTSLNINFIVCRKLNKSHLAALLKGWNQLAHTKYWVCYLTYKKPSINISPLPHFFLLFTVYLFSIFTRVYV